MWYLIVIWAIIFVLTVYIEIQSVALTSIWFSVGALVALILAILDKDLTIQIIVFLAVSTVLFIASRPFCKKVMQKNTAHTNADKIIDMIGSVTKNINVGDIGEVKVCGEIWRAVSLDTTDIQVGDAVIIKSFNGNKVVVTKVNKESTIEFL